VDDRSDVTNLRPATIGAACALGLVACFVVGVALMVSSGVQVLIPEPGVDMANWIADVDSAENGFLVGAWLGIAGGFLGIVAYVGFYDALRHAGPVLVLAPVLGAVGWTLVTISHLVPIAMATELVPDYLAADAAGKASLLSDFDLLAAVSSYLNIAGNVLNWGVVVPLYGYAILRTGVSARWIGWLGIFVGACAGWLGLLSYTWGAFEAFSFVGFIGFFVFMASMGVSLLRRSGEDVPAAVTASR
jgi:uncharacterized protein DUF4386